MLSAPLRVEDLPQGVRVSSEYPELTRRFFEKKGIDADIRLSYGATEAKVPDIVDCIVDGTETGRALRASGLKIIDTIVESFTEVIANLHWYPDTVRDRFGDGSGSGVELTYRYEPDLLGTAGGVRNVRDFFGSDDFRLKRFKNVQVFDYEGVKGRSLSSSYAPEEGHPNYEPMLAELERIFQTYQDEGKVVFEYVTQMYYGQLI